jgi:hypothetical protein
VSLGTAKGPRFSRDIDVFQHSQQRLETAAEADANALTAAGFDLLGKETGEVKRHVGPCPDNPTL